jgi:8-oxo-dGTP diphosphatase
LKIFNLLVGAIPLFAGEVLLLHRGSAQVFLPGTWGIPGGKVEFGETLEQAVSRELFEETGLSGSICGIVGYSTFFTKHDDTEVHNVQINFLVKLLSNNPISLENGYDQFKWIALENYEAENLDEFTRAILKQACSKVLTTA